MSFSPTPDYSRVVHTPASVYTAGEPNENFDAQEEEIIVQSLLEQSRQDLAQLEREISRLKAALEKAEAQRRVHVDEISRFIGALSPQKRLPSEILAMIFVHAMCDQPTILPPSTTGAPWAFLWVCSRWRQVALAEHRLWRSLDVRPPILHTTQGLMNFCLFPLWVATRMPPVSMTVKSVDYGLIVRDVLWPYFRRLQSLSLDIPTRALSFFLLGDPIPFERLDSVTLEFIVSAEHLGRGVVRVFSASPNLRRITLRSDTAQYIYPATVSRLPWSQLTHLTFLKVYVHFGVLSHMLAQCDQLVRLALTIDSSTKDDILHMDYIPELLLTKLQSLTFMMQSGVGVSSLFPFLYVPSLKEFAIKHWDEHDADVSVLWEQTQFVDLISRSRCRLESLTLSGSVKGVAFERLFQQIPSLVKLVVSNSNPVPGVVFDMMVKGAALQKLEHLECFVPSLVPFFRLLEYQCEFGYRGLSHAKITCDTRDISEAKERYELLKPKLGGKVIMLNQV
jgi:hypothetical protein